MKRINKLLILLLALTMCLLTACGEDPVATTGSNPAGDNPTPSAQAITLVENEASAYQIVYAAKGASWERIAALRIQNTIFAATGVKIPVVKDTDGEVNANAKEIILATPKNNRASTYTAKGGVNLGYHVYVDGSRLIVEAGSKTGAFFAVSDFAKQYFGFDMESGENAKRVEGFTALKVEGNYAITRRLDSAEFPYIGIPAESFEIAYHGDYYLQKCASITLCKEFEYLLGYTVFPWDISYGAEDGKHYISFAQDETLPKGGWEIRVNADGIVIAAGSYHAYEGAVEAFIKQKNSNGYFEFREGDKISGNYFEEIQNKPKPSAFDKNNLYVYNKLGDHRVMFYNVLWGNSYTGTNGTVINHPADERNQVQLEIFKEYMPDVLGLQEFDTSKREGYAGLDEGLKDLGYLPATDYIVDNASRQEYWLGAPVYDENNKLLGYKPGSGNPVGHVVDENKYGFSRTYYNNTPLYYNAATTKLIDADYYWYENQWEVGELVTDEYGTYYATVHHNGASDCASKALTWGVFESLKTGDRYIAISTHMCTRSDAIRALQAQEVVEVIAELVAEYDCPVLFGGDMNGNKGQSNYDLFVSEEVGYKSLQDHDLATVYTSKTAASHAYPDHKNGILTTGGGVSQNAPVGSNIDQIFAINFDSVEFKVFSIVVDMCSLRGSDHLPIYTDFSFKKD